MAIDPRGNLLDGFGGTFPDRQEDDFSLTQVMGLYTMLPGLVGFWPFTQNNAAVVLPVASIPAHASTHAVAGSDPLTNVPDHDHSGDAGDGAKVRSGHIDVDYNTVTATDDTARNDVAYGDVDSMSIALTVPLASVIWFEFTGVYWGDASNVITTIAIHDSANNLLGSEWFVRQNDTADRALITFHDVILVAAGAWTFKLRWKTANNAGNLNLRKFSAMAFAQ